MEEVSYRQSRLRWPAFLFGSAGFPVKRYSPQRPNAAKPQPNTRTEEINRKKRKVRKRRNRIISRQAAKAQREIIVISNEKRNLLRSLAFARDDRPRACRLASLRLGGRNVPIRESSIGGLFARLAQIFNFSNTEFTEGLFKVPFLEDLLCVLCASAVQTPSPASVL